MVLKPLIPIISFVVEISFALENQDQSLQQYRNPLLLVDLTHWPNGCLNFPFNGTVVESLGGSNLSLGFKLLNQERAKHHENRYKNFVIWSLHGIKILLLDF